jgi:cholesterol oxidase
MHASVAIDDLDRFVSELDHAGALSGRISYPPIGTNIPSVSGRFNLFSPSGDRRLRYMVYELGFRQGDIDYYLAGKKEVRDDPGLDLWADTTTLLAQLHRGQDASGPVVGAGVLHLDAPKLAGLVTTMRVTNARSPVEGAQALAKFGRFFLGALWESYGKAASTPWWKRWWRKLVATFTR